ncbi:hypothetical protein J7T55_007528 [Diaporthe amygdali]|uniref:uncharacterized protein n=1 Tax=Phomopsis amygdali TaxID=1214568 RepID=UPI0022FECAB5|nr:uncharacterized protein J7T55_007528 [Diaporthe amygdali]KAJ0116548.1 hypothetical protein J7T55_007528 [Diaporthe amygdali]
MSEAGPDPSHQDSTSPALKHYAPSGSGNEYFDDFLEPAIDGPPSPARIRALSNKVKQASVSERHVSQQTTSSGSSSLLSLGSVDRRPSWDQALESFSLSRKSSTRSTTSSMRERPESVQAIGKAIFNRKTKLRRESLVNSGGSSVYSTDMAPDSTGERSRAPSVTKEHTLSGMNFFNRRRTVQAPEEALSQKRPQISSPFNFQHVAQIQRDQVPTLEQSSQVLPQNEWSAARASEMPAMGASKGIMAEDLRVPNFSSKATRPHDDDDIAPHVVPHRRENSIVRPPSWHKSPPRPMVKHSRSQDQIPGAPPPRPPRSPTDLDLNFDLTPPVPPPRSSSRPSVPRRDSEALGNIMTDRSQGLSGFRFPPPLSIHTDANSPPSTSQGPSSPTATAERRYSRFFLPSPTETPNWPLTCPLHNASVSTFEAGLPDVPEEEEQHGLPKRSRASIRSTNSSLRGSQSVPALRKASVSDYSSHDRSLSRESTIFGHFDMAAAERAEREAMENTQDDSDPLPRDIWEDVIDYCYEHEAEAHCDYDWDRPSIDMGREPTFLFTEDENDDGTFFRPTSDHFEIPALSPCSHLSVGSAQDAQEAITPTISASGTKSPTRSNFSLPRRDGGQPQRLLHVRTTSQASVAKEGFTLSPSMLIPTDYHQEMLAHQNERFEESEGLGQAVTWEEPTMTADGANLFVPIRASNSTTASAMSSRSNFDRHISTTSSTNTDYTRMTMSTSSVNIEDYLPKDDAPRAITKDDPETSQASAAIPHARSQSIAGLLNSMDSSPLSRGNHSSDPNLDKLRSAKRQVGRGRARTLSSSPPPPGQYALFPRPANLK